MHYLRHYALIFIVLAIIAGNIRAQTPIVIKFSHINSSFSPKGLAANHFKELAEKITQGKVRVDVYSDGQLYNNSEELEALQLGAVQMLAPSLSKFSTLGLHGFELFDLPYLFPDTESLNRVTQGAIGRTLLSKLETKGIVGLGIWDNGFKNIFSNTPIRTPKDMRGLKIRILPSAVLKTQILHLGATPVNLSYQDMIDHLQKKLIDGSENPPSTFYRPNLVGATKYLTVTNHGYLGYAVIINKKFWDQLPSTLRIQLSSAMVASTKYANVVAKQQNEQDLTTLKKSGEITVFELSDAEKALWRAAMLPVQKQMESRIGKKLIDDVNQVVTASETKK